MLAELCSPELADAQRCIADPRVSGRFVERPIRTGTETGDRVAIESGVVMGESVVTGGGFFLRAERERLNLSAGAVSPQAIAGQAPMGPQTVRVTVSDKGFGPDRLTLKAGVPAQVTFVRTTDATCATEVVFPSLNIRRDIPLNTPVVIDLIPSTTEIGFVCGVNMFRGTIAAQ